MSKKRLSLWHTTTIGPTSGDTTVLDYDKTGTISGGTFIGTGSSMMAQSIDGNGQANLKQVNKKIQGIRY